MKHLSLISKIVGSGLLFILMFYGCDDIFEKDLSGKKIVLLAPSDSLKTELTTTTFWWEKLDGALSYNLQVVSPSFNHVEKILADTTVTVNKFTLTLYPGKFEWRIKALNGSSQTAYFLRSMEVDSTMDLQKQELVLKTPNDGSALNASKIILQWYKLYNATQYRVQVKATDWSGSNVISPVFTNYDTLSVSSLSEGTYVWGVQALNESSSSNFFTRKFTIDRTAPSTPSLLLPADRGTVTQSPVSLSWTRVTDSGTTLTDSIVVASDTIFSSGNIKLAKRIDATSYSLEIKDKGSYFWKVKTIDAAGNQSSFTAVRKFTVQF
ncbi:MAG: hypothetical protein Q8928_10355 [Bacteroidota bacterium]|nr:hypothetical protein [Bacteroidota bacterium]